jgi:hypothetical protein
MTDVTNERWNQHSTILTLKGELAKQIGIADAARLEALELRRMLDDAATATSELMATAKHWQDRAEIAEEALREIKFRAADYKHGDSRVEMAFRGIARIARVVLENKP